MTHPSGERGEIDIAGIEARLATHPAFSPGDIRAILSHVKALEAKLAEARNAALEEAAGAMCFGCAHGWPLAYHKLDPDKRFLMHMDPQSKPGDEPGHPCNASNIRSLKATPAQGGEK